MYILANNRKETISAYHRTLEFMHTILVIHSRERMRADRPEDHETRAHLARERLAGIDIVQEGAEENGEQRHCDSIHNGAQDTDGEDHVVPPIRVPKEGEVGDHRRFGFLCSYQGLCERLVGLRAAAHGVVRRPRANGGESGGRARRLVRVCRVSLCVCIWSVCMYASASARPCVFVSLCVFACEIVYTCDLLEVMCA